MGILQVAVNNIKCKFSSLIEDSYIQNNYGIKLCKNFSIKDFNSVKLELIFLDNLNFINLNQKQISKIASGNYKNLFKRKVYSGKMSDITLEDPVIVNNITIVNNVASEQNDEWLTTDF